MRPLRSLLPLLGLLVAAFVVGASPKTTPSPSGSRRVAVRLAEGIDAGTAFDPGSVWARRKNVELQAAAEGVAVPKGFEVVHVAVLPATPPVPALLAKFPVTLEEKAFVFDGRTFAGEEDAILLTDPARPGETVVLGVTADTAVRLAQRRILFGEETVGDYVLVTGGVAGLRKSGRFVTSGSVLAIDRPSDRDAIAERAAFYDALHGEKRGGVEWELRESEKSVLARWEKAAAGFAGKKPFRVRVYPDAVTKGLYTGSTGSSAPASLVAENGAIRVDLAADAPETPDLVTPVLAAAGLAAANPGLLQRPTILAAAGARRVGRWWGRDVRPFAAFTAAAGVSPSIEEIMRRDATDVSAVLAVGSAAAWLDAGVRLESEAAVTKVLLGADAALSGKLWRWREAAFRQSVRPPERRPLPEGFLRGVSLAQSATLEGAYGTPRSLETLRALAALSVNSIALMPSAVQRDAAAPGIDFVQRPSRGETDEGTLRAVADARSLGMSAMLKPQLWVGGGTFTDDIAMPDDAAWREWFAGYRRFIVHHAVVAEAAGAALFCVGTEVRGTELRKNDWKEAIAAVRLATGAPVTYAARWAAGTADIPFWDALDAIGVDFYDPLTRTEKATDAVLEQGVRTAARAAAEVSKALSNKPVIFTEAGYSAVRASWTAPRDESSARPSAPEDAARAIAAVHRALGAEPWWRGVYWWRVFSDGRAALAGDRGFNLLGTPSGKAMAEGFRQREKETGRP